jgi:hypothetical protein
MVINDCLYVSTIQTFTLDMSSVYFLSLKMLMLKAVIQTIALMLVTVLSEVG